MSKQRDNKTEKLAQSYPIAGTNDPAEDFLKQEYNLLIDLYTHTENTIYSVFNFYLTLLSAITGAMIVLGQINNASIKETLPTFSVLLGLIILMGVITQDAVVNKNIELARYALALNLLKKRFLSNSPEEMKNVFYMEYMFASVIPVARKKIYLTDKLHQKIWWLLPLGTHQLSISVINSLALAILGAIVTYSLSNNSIPLWRLLVGGIIIVVATFETHCIYARTKHRNGIEKFTTAAGTEASW